MIIWLFDSNLRKLLIESEVEVEAIETNSGTQLVFALLLLDRMWKFSLLIETTH